MSIALNRPEGPDRDIHHLIIFVVLSVILHLGIALGLFSYGPYAERLMKLISPKKNEPVMVDVVELPALPPGVKPKTDFRRPPAHFAERAQSVDKETYPEAPKVGQLHPASRGGASQPRVPGLAPPAPPGTPSPSEKGVAPKAISGGENSAGGIPASEAGDLPLKGAASGQSNSVNATTKAEGKTATKTGQNKPNLFLSNDQIADLEKKYEAEAPKGEKGKTLQLNTSELKYQRYLLAMKDAIERKWEYPAIAAASGWQGVLRINFTINKDGTVSNIQVLKSSNYPVLDDAAVTALKLAAPFPPFPDNFTIEEINIKGTFEYDIVPNQIRGRD
jgi:TonB family protein